MIEAAEKVTPAPPAAPPPARPAPREVRSGDASQTCNAPPAVNMIEPAKNVTPTARAPTAPAYPGNGPIRKHAAPPANRSAIQRSRLIARPRPGRPPKSALVMERRRGRGGLPPLGPASAHAAPAREGRKERIGEPAA